MTLRKTFRTALAAVLLPLAVPALADTGDGKAGHAHGSHAHGPHGHAAASIVTPADPSKATRTVEVTLGDLTVAPAIVEVKAGETVRFVVRNEGTLLHAFEVGSPAQQADAQAHTAEMVAHGMITDTAIVPGTATMDHGAHGTAHKVMATLLVEPGRTAETAFTFAEAAALEIACSMPGHYEAGMAARLDVK